MRFVVAVAVVALFGVEAPPAPRTAPPTPSTNHRTPRLAPPAPRTAHPAPITYHPAPRTAPPAPRTSHLAPRTSQAATAAPTPTLQVWLVTLGEGQYYWEKFGHNALWFLDPAQGIDVVFNWGTFDFNEPGYLGRLLIGDTRYWVDTIPSAPFFSFYQQYDRSIVLQRLNLTPEQAMRAYQYSRWNAREENRYYQYDYFRDNCSTRVRDVIDLALGGALKRATATRQTDLTYRGETLRLVDDMKLTQFGINAALGQPSDEPLSVWEDMFAPGRVRVALAALRVPGANGAEIPVVAEERVFYESRAHQESTSVPSLALPYLVVGVLLAALLAVSARLGERSRAGEIAFRTEATVWAALTGLLGVIILLAWLITQHVFWFRNENLLLFNPIAIFLAVLIPLASRSRWRRPAAVTAIVVALLAAVALIVKGLPWFDQANLAMIFLLLPPHFAIAHALWRRARSVRM